MHVQDKYRKNPLSHQWGGSEVTVYYENGEEFTYDKVKFPQKYIKRICLDDPRIGEWVDDEEEMLQQMKAFIERIEVDGDVVWDRDTSEELPWTTKNLRDNEDDFEEMERCYYRNRGQGWHRDNEWNNDNEWRNLLNWDEYDSNLDMDQQSPEFWG